MTKQITRRKFIQAAGLTGAAMAVSGCTVNLQRSEKLVPYVTPPEEALPGENIWYASACRQCPAGCGILVRVSNGRAHKIEGNPLHPLNQGKLCARGQAGLQALYNPDRLRTAVSQSPRGSRDLRDGWRGTLRSSRWQIASRRPAKARWPSMGRSAPIAWRPSSGPS